MGFFDGFGFNQVLSGIGSVFNSAAQLKGVREMNKTNLQIARETNEANRANQEYQNEWNLNMWNAQNEYNSPLASRQRMEAAGFNPIFMGLDGAGTAEGLTSAPFVAQMGAPMSNEGAALGNSVMNGLRQMAEIGLIKAQTKKTEEDTIGTGLYNHILSATVGTQIAIAGANLEVTQEMKNKLKQDQAESVSRINQMEANIRQVDEQIALATKRYTLDDWKAKVDYELSKSKLSQDRELALKRLSVDWYVAKQQGRMVDLSFLNSVVERENKRADTGLKRSQSKNNDINNEFQAAINQARINSDNSSAAKNDADAKWGSGTLGTVLRFGNEIITEIGSLF